MKWITTILSILKLKLPVWLIVILLGLGSYLYFSMDSKIDSLTDTVNSQSRSLTKKDGEIKSLTSDNSTLKGNNTDLKLAISDQNTAIEKLKVARDNEIAAYKKKLANANALLADRDEQLKVLNSEANTTFEDTDQASMLWLKSRASSSLAW